MNSFAQRLHDNCVKRGVSTPIIVNKEDWDWSYIIMFLSEYGVKDIRAHVDDGGCILLSYDDIRDALKHPEIYSIFQTIISTPRKLKIKVI
jgi:hypothetical protein